MSERERRMLRSYAHAVAAYHSSEGGVEQARRVEELEDELVALLRASSSAEPREPERVTDLEESAWGLIANANEGNWEAAHPEWKDAAIRWREAYHAKLRAPQADAVGQAEVKAVQERLRVNPGMLDFLRATQNRTTSSDPVVLVLSASSSPSLSDTQEQTEESDRLQEMVAQVQEELRPRETGSPSLGPGRVPGASQRRHPRAGREVDASADVARWVLPPSVDLPPGSGDRTGNEMAIPLGESFPTFKGRNSMRKLRLSLATVGGLIMYFGLDTLGFNGGDIALWSFVFAGFSVVILAATSTTR